MIAREDENILVVNIAGSLIAMPDDSNEQQVVPPQSLALVRGPKKIALSLARGKHDRFVVLWQDAIAPALGDWIKKRLTSKARAAGAFQIVCQPVDVRDGNLVQRLVDTFSHSPSLGEPRLWSDVHLAVGSVLTSQDGFVLAYIPADLPDPIRKLLIAVKADPTRSWSLKDASAEAGYSPFHLSRTFKVLVGYGFPEFVDRCRTEKAFGRLSTTHQSIDDIAEACGFGSTQGLRESVKEYLGLLPSELRQTPAQESDA